jgi:aspartyl-tRNA(Asn)/glutamyl-tRNA(Gln) amidotransferase subunit A
MSDDLCMMPATDLVAAYRARRLSPVEVTRAVLERIAQYDGPPRLHLVTEKEAWRQRASEARWMRGEPVGLLDGVPTTVKDVVLMKGHPTRRGSRTTPDTPEAEDAPITARLRPRGPAPPG